MTDPVSNAVGFLLFSYFSFSLDDLHNCRETKPFAEAIIARACRDASSHVLSVQGKNPNDNEPGNRPIDCIINEIAGLNHCEDYHAWHRELCVNKLPAYYNQCEWGKNGSGDDLEFSIGIAQKWVNMTMKYFMLVVDLASEYAPESLFLREYRPIIDRHRNSLHVPIDRYIIDVLWNLDPESIILPLKDAKTKREKSYKRPSDHVTPWSRWTDYDAYLEVQKALRHIIKEKAPIDWEGPEWIVQAKKSNGKS